MTQLFRSLTEEQVKVVVNGYYQGLLKRADVQEMLGVDKTRFFALVKEYRSNPEVFSIRCEISSPGRLSQAVEADIDCELLRKKAIIDGRRSPSYSARSPCPSLTLAQGCFLPA
jgi:hypothetical protein